MVGLLSTVRFPRYLEQWSTYCSLVLAAAPLPNMYSQLWVQFCAQCRLHISCIELSRAIHRWVIVPTIRAMWAPWLYDGLRLHPAQRDELLKRSNR